MWKRLLISLTLCAILAAIGNASIKVLIIDGFSNHDWKRTSKCIQELLDSKKGKYEVDVSTFPASAPQQEQDAWNPNFEKYDVVIQNSNDGGESGISWPEKTKRHFEKYISQGGSMLAFHSANNAFRDWKAYNQMIGLGWRDKNFGTALSVNDKNEIVRIPPGEGKNTSHGVRIDALITRLGEHPIHRGIPRRWKAADIEVYSYARGPADNVTVLSFALEPVTQLNFPIEWTVNYGKGRIYTSTLGHIWPNEQNLKGIQCAGFQTVFFRALDWLAQSPQETDIPDDFPTEEKTSLRKTPKP